MTVRRRLKPSGRGGFETRPYGPTVLRRAGRGQMPTQLLKFAPMPPYPLPVEAARGGKGKDKPCPYRGFWRWRPSAASAKTFIFSPFSPAAAGEKGVGGMRGR